MYPVWLTLCPLWKGGPGGGGGGLKYETRQKAYLFGGTRDTRTPFGSILMKGCNHTAESACRFAASQLRRLQLGETRPLQKVIYNVSWLTRNTKETCKGNKQVCVWIKKKTTSVASVNRMMHPNICDAHLHHSFTSWALAKTFPQNREKRIGRIRLES